MKNEWSISLKIWQFLQKIGKKLTFLGKICKKVFLSAAKVFQNQGLFQNRGFTVFGIQLYAANQKKIMQMIRPQIKEINKNLAILCYTWGPNPTPTVGNIAKFNPQFIEHQRDFFVPSQKMKFVSWNILY